MAAGRLLISLSSITGCIPPTYEVQINQSTVFTASLLGQAGGLNCMKGKIFPNPKTTSNLLPRCTEYSMILLCQHNLGLNCPSDILPPTILVKMVFCPFYFHEQASYIFLYSCSDFL